MPRHTGIHPENRHGTGVNPLDAQNLMLKITQPGYSKRVKLDERMRMKRTTGRPLQTKAIAIYASWSTKTP